MLFRSGIGWWTSPQILFFAIPAFATCGLPCAKLRNLVRITTGFCIGAAPWIATNIATKLASIRSQPPRSGSFVDYLSTQLSTGWPMAFGLRLPFDEMWMFDSAPLLFMVIATLFLTAALLVYRTHRRAIAGALGVIPVFILLQALAPTGSHVGTGRYYIFIVPSIAIVVVAASSARTRLGMVSRGAIVVMMLTLSVAGTWLSRDRRMEPTGVQAMAAELVNRELLHVRADYWSAYVLAWYEPDLVVAPNHTDRRPSWTAAVDGASEVAEVFWLGVDYEQQRFDEFMAGSPLVVSSEMVDDWAIVVVNQRP